MSVLKAVSAKDDLDAKVTEIAADRSKILDSLDRLASARAMLNFMTSAISMLWGSDHTEFGEERTVRGCHVIMEHVENEISTAHEDICSLLRKGEA